MDLESAHTLHYLAAPEHLMLKNRNFWMTCIRMFYPCHKNQVSLRLVKPRTSYRHSFVRWSAVGEANDMWSHAAAAADYVPGTITVNIPCVLTNNEDDIIQIQKLFTLDIMRESLCSI